MGAIKDIIDLCIALQKESSDRRVVEAISKIQPLTLALQQEQATIVEKNTELLTENHNLKLALHDLRQSHAQAMAELEEKHRVQIFRITGTKTEPKNELEPVTIEILKLFFQASRPLSDTGIARHFRMARNLAIYHIEQLLGRKFIVQTRAGPLEFEIQKEGREYIIKNKLFDPNQPPPDQRRPPPDPHRLGML